MFELIEALQEELADVRHAESVLAFDAASGEHGEDFSERGVDGGSGLEILDGLQDVGGDIVGRWRAVELLAKVKMAESGVAGVEQRGAAAAVSGEGGATNGVHVGISLSYRCEVRFDFFLPVGGNPPTLFCNCRI